MLRRRWLKILGAIAVLVGVLVLLGDGDWFRPLVERQASQAIGRSVRLGHFDVHLWAGPQLVLDRIELRNPESFPADSNTASIERLAIRIQPRALFDHTVNLTEVEIDKPAGELGPGPDGT